MKINDIREANELLAKYVPNSRIPGSYSLDRMEKLMTFLGNPQNKLKVVHVAGTSGKTSTSYYAAALLRAAGKKVGLTVSPHVTEVNERVQIDLEPLPEKDFCLELANFLNLIENFDIEPSYFELLVAFAYWEFERQDVDYAVIEVGLGGLLDGTNVISRVDKVCIITDIALDHINILGTTLPEIAAQKAGIIKNNNVAFCHQQKPEIIEVFQKRAKENAAKLNVLDKESEKNSPKFLPLFQRRNFSLALAAINYVLERDGIQSLNEAQKVEAAHQIVPARMETFERGNKTIILDGAHNSQKLQTLGASLKEKYPGQEIAALVSFVDGRSYRLESSLSEIAQFTRKLIITSFISARQDLPYGPVKPEILAKLAREKGFESVQVAGDPRQAYGKLLEQPEPILLITGSFYIMEDLRDLVKG